MEDPALPGIAVSLVETDWDVALFDLSFGLGEFRGEVLGGLQYNVDLFDASTVDRWGEHFRILLEAAIQDPDRALRDLPRLTEPERRQILADPEPLEDEELRTRARIAGREEELAERRSGLSDQKRAALEKLLRARVKPK
jgi:non-ribosomal peptide synthetase component F